VKKIICLLLFFPILSCNNQEYRDLNKNGKLDVYEDKSQAVEDRVNDLISQMTIKEKAGSMFIDIVKVSFENESIKNTLPIPIPDAYEMMSNYSMNHIHIIDEYDPKKMLEWYNDIQKVAENSRLGIPITLASNPRHGVQSSSLDGSQISYFSNWPSDLGLGAIGDEKIVEEFADIVRQEYNAIGIKLALSPMADIASEPRWVRINGTYGEDANLNARLTKAYISGLQGDKIDIGSVSAMVKHFPGSGPVDNGEDTHFPPGTQSYPGNNFDYHLIPFEAAINNNVSSIMPYYSVPVGLSNEDVAAGYNKFIINDLLREKYSFDGIICTDWGIVTDITLPNGVVMKPAGDFGVEDLSINEKLKKIISVGVDLIGGEKLTTHLIELIESDEISEERIDESLERIMTEKFKLGLFDNPFLDESNLTIINNDNFKEKGIEAQKRSLVLLKNDNKILPLKNDIKFHLVGFPENFSSNLENNSSIEESDVIIYKLNNPPARRSKPKYLMEEFFGGGPLDYSKNETEEILNYVNLKPTILIFTVQRPYIITEISENSNAVIADFEVENSIILDLIFGRFSPSGTLPLDLPSSLNDVENQIEDLSFDQKNPLYRFGHGLKYE
jgi:beta-glucosidase